MSFKKFFAILVLGITISIGFVFFLRLRTRDTPKYLTDESVALPPIIPRTVNIPEEIREKFAAAPKKPELIATIEHGGDVDSVTFSPTESSLLVSKGRDKSIKLWHLSSPNEPKAVFKGNSASFSPNGEFLAISNLKDGTTLYNVRTKQKVNTFRSVGRDSIFSPDGKWLAVGTIGGVQLWDIRSPTQARKGPRLLSNGLAEHLSFSADGKLLTASDRDRGDVYIWQIDGYKPIEKANFNIKTEKDKWVEKLAFLPDAENPVLAIAENDKNIHLLSSTNWERYSELAAGYVNDFAFTSDASMLVSGGHSEIELWSVESGERILKIDGYSRWVNCVDISADGNYIAGCGNDGILRIWNIDDDIYSQQNEPSDLVKLIYFLPTDRAAQADLPQKLGDLIQGVQSFFADEMERHGFGKKTFTVSKNGNGSPKVYLLEGRTAAEYYFIKTAKKVRREVEQVFDSSKNIHLIVVDIRSVLIRKEGSIVSASPRTFTIDYNQDVSGLRGGDLIMTTGHYDNSIVLVAKYLGYTFGLNSNLRDPTYMMSYGKNITKLSLSSAEWLNRSRYFNPNQTFYDSHASIEKLSELPGKLRLRIKDANGIHQVRLLVKPTNVFPPTGYARHTEPHVNNREWENKHKGKIFILHDYLTLNAKDETSVAFDFPESAMNQIRIQVIDVNGNMVYREMKLIDDTESSIIATARRLFR